MIYWANEARYINTELAYRVEEVEKKRKGTITSNLVAFMRKANRNLSAYV